MLNWLVGRSLIERTKTGAIALLTGLLVLSLWQVSIENIKATEDDQNRQVAGSIARRFAMALTTYDYAHLDVQRVQVRAVCTSALADRIDKAAADLAAARASSLGGVTDTITTRVTSSDAEVLVGTVQVVTASYAAAGSKLTGLLDIKVKLMAQGWVVTDYQWMVTPTGQP